MCYSQSDAGQILSEVSDSYLISGRLHIALDLPIPHVPLNTCLYHWVASDRKFDC
jgi:hypothetical protein